MTQAYSLNDFCKAYGISRSFFYKLQSQDKAPKTIKLNGKVLISAESANEWKKALEA